MFLASLKLKDFRNFTELNLSLAPRLNFFVGENGQGKTNLIEAAYLLSRGISFRPSDPGNFIRRFDDQSKAVVAPSAFVGGKFLKRNLEFVAQLRISEIKKSALINDKRANSADLMRIFPTVLFSPESLAAIKEGPEQRRALVDEILLTHEPRQGQLLRQFSRTLRARNRLLKNLANGIGPRIEQTRALESLNKIYLLLATHLTVARLQALEAIAENFRQAVQIIVGSGVGDSSVDYVISKRSALKWSDSEVFDSMNQRLVELHTSELRLGSSLVGPHKHDIKILFAGNDSRFYCSQGQQRALILALKIAQIVYHQTVHQTYPVLLLDDVLSELDLNKRVNLMKFLESIAAQVLITSTDLSWSENFSAERNCIYEVAHGQVTLRA